MPPEVEPVAGSLERLRRAMADGLRAFHDENRGVLSASEVADVATLHLVDAAWHMGLVTLPEPKVRRFLAGIVDAAFAAVETIDPATLGEST